MFRRSALLAALAASLAVPAAAHASPTMEVGVADDRLLFESPEQAASTVADWQAAGVDTIRIIARWGAVAPAANDIAPPAGFDPANPDDPRYDWRALDRAVGEVTGAQMRVLLTVTGWGPIWGSRFPAKRNPRWKPDPQRFAQFATAVARRYGASVDRYIVWNEPNVAQWMQPQSQCSQRGTCTPSAPHQLRRIYEAAEPAIRAADPGAQVMIGALAPRGTSGASQNANLRPLAFLRALGCVDGRYRKVRTGACRGFTPVTADLLAFHPHGLKMAPTTHDPVRDDAQLGDVGRLASVVDRIQRAGGIRVRGASRLPFWFDEYAYQTNPPDRVLGVSPALQATYLQQAAYLAWTNPRVRGLAWYVWRDEPLAGSTGGWQSGLRYVDGRAKPALAVFPQPFWALRKDSRTIRVWGQVRPGDAHSVMIERRSGAAWRTVATLTTDARGGFLRDLRTSGGTFRFRWESGTSASRSVR